MTDTTRAAASPPNWQAVRTYEDIRFERDGGLAKITICRPHKRNAGASGGMGPRDKPEDDNCRLATGRALSLQLDLDEGDRLVGAILDIV